MRSCWLVVLVILVAGPLAAAQEGGVPVVSEQAVRLGSVRQSTMQDGAGIRFRHLTINEGLSQNAVYALAQDREGFLWIGTKDGLNRYDGTGFTVFEHDPFDPATLPSSYITVLLAGEGDALWVGTQDGGLARLDRSTGAVLRYANSPRHRITALARDRRGTLWIGTLGDGAYRLGQADQHQRDAPFERVRLGDIPSRDTRNVRALLVDRHGAAWVGVEHVVVRIGEDGGRTQYRPRTDRSVVPEEAQVTALLETRAGQLWVGTVSGLNRFDPPAGGAGSGAVGTFTFYPSASPWPEGGGGAMIDLVEGPRGDLWFGSPEALGRFDPATGAQTFFRHEPLDPASLVSNHITVLLWDRTDVLWIGTNGYGLDHYDAKASRFETIRRPPDPSSRQVGFSVRALFEDGESLWVSAGRVLYRLDRRTGRLASFERPSAEAFVFGNSGVWDIVRSRDGALWFGSHEGLYRRTADGRVRHYAHDPKRSEGLRSKNVYGVFEDRRGQVWAVTARHLSRLDDPATGRFTHFEHTPASTTSVVGFNETLFPSLHEDAEGRFWMGTETGLVRFDPASGAVRRYRTDPSDPASLHSEQVRAVTPDLENPDVLWLGTAGGGLARFDRRAETFRHVTEADGLPDDVVYAVLPDDAGHLWLSTNRGLARYHPATGAVKTYDVHDGLQSNEFNSGAYHRTVEGRIYFGGIHGVTTFQPAEVTDNPHVPAVALTGLRIGNRPVAIGDSTGLLARALWETDALRLGHEQNMVTFEFAALDFSAPENNRYAYRMEGFDERWIEAGTARTATYTNLPPGGYAFRVRAANNDGVWNEAGAAVRLTVAPPPWRTWWAYVGYALGLFGLGTWAVRDRRRRDRLKLQAERERVEAEQLRALDQARSRFFANVSHEFRTPLTLTLGPLDDLRSGLYGEPPTPMVAQLDLARRNAARVLALVNQILDVTRLEAGRTPLRARRLGLGAFAAAVAQTFAPLAARRAVAFDVTVPDDGDSVWADPAHLEKVLANLISNALKFTPEGGTVRVAVEADDEASRVTVRDSGPGIPAAHLPHLFERFYRVDESAARMQAGTGIGLALVKELVHLHGGTIEVESEEGFGSTFTVTLPRGDAHLAPEQRVESDAPFALEPLALVAPSGDGALPPAAAPPDDHEDDRTTVLVVEDHPDVRAYVRRHLEPDYRVVEAGDGEEGLARARSVQPDVIVSDVMMPRLDGLGLCRALKTDPETDFIPVLLLTAKAEQEDRLAGLREHAEGYLTKPFDPAELRVRIASLIAVRKRLRERFRQDGLPPAAAPATGTPGTLTTEEAAFLDDVYAAVEARLDDEAFNVEEMAAAVGVSRGHLHRQLKALAGQTPSALLWERRLARAAHLLTVGAGTVGETAYAVGFKSVAHFSNAFGRHFGCRPSAYPPRADD